MDLVVVSCAIPPLSWEHRRRAPLSKTAFRAARGTCPGTRRKQAGGAEPIWGRHVSALAANRSMTPERQANRLPAFVRFGSKAARTISAGSQPTSALPRKRTTADRLGRSAQCQKRTHPPQHTTHGLRALCARELDATVRGCADAQCSWPPLSRPPWARRASVPAGKRQRSFKPFCF